MSGRKIDWEEVYFLHSHGWSAQEIADKIGCHPNSVWNILSRMGRVQSKDSLRSIRESIDVTKKRIEFFLNHRNPCEFTWEENLVELLQGFRRLISRKNALVKN